MRTNQAARATPNLVDKPEQIGPALAQVIQIEAGRDIILGQAWMAAPDQLVTCGHVVDRFVADCGGLFVHFPSSGKRYPVQEVRLHPSFVRQPDGLVKFDAAVLKVRLAPPDSMALPLPFGYEQTLRTNQTLWTIRYPVHLGQLSAALQPLSQDGHFLGLLRKHDSFHLLHDVALAPGDSGAPLCDGQIVVAMHCGDTATIPGLNLPTTSIRLALWVDALRELGLQPTQPNYQTGKKRWLSALLAFAIASLVGFGALTALNRPPAAEQLLQPAMMPLEVNFNEQLDRYKPEEVVEIFLVPKTPCYAFMFLTDEAGHVIELYPTFGNHDVISTSVTVGQGSKEGGEERVQLQATKANLKLYVVAVDPNAKDASNWVSQFVKPEEFAVKNSGALTIDEKTLVARIQEFQKAHPAAVFYHVFPMPRAQ